MQTLTNLEEFKSYNVSSLTILKLNERSTGEIQLKIPNTWTLQNTLQNNPWIKEQVSVGI